jgi:hypothetical protein
VDSNTRALIERPGEICSFCTSTLPKSSAEMNPTQLREIMSFFDTPGWTLLAETIRATILGLTGSLVGEIQSTPERNVSQKISIQILHAILQFPANVREKIQANDAELLGPEKLSELIVRAEEKEMTHA